MSKPYPVSYNPNNGYYQFQTDYNVTYTCGFHGLNISPILGVYDIEVADFEFFPNHHSKTKDPRVSDTVGEMISAYFENENRVLIYLCDNADGRARERSALFKHWSNRMDIIHEPVKIQEQDIDIYGGVLTRKDFPHGDVLRTELIDKASGFIVQKFGR